MAINQERINLIKSILEDETIASEEDEALHLLLQEQISKNPAAESKTRLTAGQKAADGVARFAGSWGFIIVFFVVLLIWILLNAFFLKSFLHAKPFDPYPFILMNLILSCIAAIQAPIIMMSQNRQEQKDRERSKNDYKVNLKAEIMVEDIHQKLDAIMERQQTLVEQLAAFDKQSK